MNNIILIGRLATDPELKYVGKSNDPVTNFKIAVSRNYYNASRVFEEFSDSNNTLETSEDEIPF